jgi:hypothetical protein
MHPLSNKVLNNPLHAIVKKGGSYDFQLPLRRSDTTYPNRTTELKMAAKHQLPKVLFGTSSLGNLFVELTHEV